MVAQLKRTQGVNAYRVIPQVLGIAATPDMVELGWPYIAGVALIDKMADFSTEITRGTLSEEEQSYHSQCGPMVRNALAPVRMSQPWEQARATLNELLVSRLEGANVALKRSVREEMLQEADSQELRASISAALSTLFESTLSPDLKDFVMTHLLRINGALDQYHYRGVAGLREAVAGYLGSLSAGREEIQRHIPDTQKATLTDVLAKANKAIALAKGVAWAWPLLAAGWERIVGLLAS